MLTLDTIITNMSTQSNQTTSTNNQTSASANTLPMELWCQIASYESRHNAAVLVSHLRDSRHPLVRALKHRTAGEYVYVCPISQTIVGTPCVCNRTSASSRGHKVALQTAPGMFLCPDHVPAKCACPKDTLEYYTEVDIQDHVYYAQAVADSAFHNAVWGGFVTEYDYFQFEKMRTEVAGHREYLRSSSEFAFEGSDFGLSDLFQSERKLKTLGPKGADVEPEATPAPTEPAPPLDPRVDPDQIVDDRVPDTTTAPEPARTTLPAVVPTDPAAQPVVNSGYVAAPTLPNEISGEPVDEPAHQGWLSWEDGDMGKDAVMHAGTIVRSSRSHDWSVSLQPSFNSVYPPGQSLEQAIRAYSEYVTPQFTLQFSWGYGAPTPEAEILKAGYYDMYNITQMTHSGRNVLIPLARETIGYNVPFGLSVYQRAMPFNSLASVTPTSDLYSQIGHRQVTSRYHRMILTASQRGNNHIALGATMYMRLVAARIASEQGANPILKFKGSEFNRFLGRVGTADSVLVETARSFATKTPLNMVTIPRGARKSEPYAMYYLAGNGRMQIPWLEGDDTEEKLLYSALDAYVPENKFLLTPILNDARIMALEPDSDNTFALDAYSLESIVVRYFTCHNLWEQFPVMRAFAWAILAHPATSVNISFPAPMHTSELQLNLWPNTTAGQVSRILGDTDHLTSLHASVVAAARNCEEVLTDGIISAVTSSGISYTNPAFKATVEQELGRHLSHGYAHMIQPVLEKLLSAKFPELTQFLSDSVLALHQCTAGRDLDLKVFRPSSYLCIGEEPEGEGWQLVFSESKRKSISSSRYYSKREALVAAWLTQRSVTIKQSTVTYSEHEMLPLGESRTSPVYLGLTGKNKLTNLVGKPTMWDYAVSGLLGRAPQPKNSGMSSNSNPELNDMEDAFARLLAREILPERKGPLDDDEDDEDDIFENTDDRDAPDHMGTNTVPVKNDVGTTGAQVAPTLPPPREKGFTLVENGAAPITSNKPEVMVISSIYAKLPSQTTPTNKGVATSKKQKKSKWRNACASDDDNSWYEQLDHGAKGYAGTSGPNSLLNLGELLSKTTLTKDEVKRLDTYYPRGADAGLKRAPYTAANLWVRRRIICKDENKLNHLLQLYKNAAYGKNAWLVTLALYLLTNTLSEPAYQELVDAGILNTPYEHWNSKWGSYNDLVRNRWAAGTFEHTSEDLPQMLYIANMVGRPHRDVDWDDEVVKRKRRIGEIKVATAVGMVHLSEEELEHEILATLLAEGSLKVKKVQPFEGFYKDRASWMIKGSAAGERMLVNEYKSVLSEVKELGVTVRQRATKTDVAEYVTYQEILDVLEGISIHLAKAHTKGNEHGKLRAIYGSLYTHYVLGSYWSHYLEDTMQLKSASMNKDNSTLLEETMQRIRSCENGRWIVCLDYADFNSQHTGTAQRSVLRAVYKWACMKGFKPTAEFSKIHDWYSESFTNQWFQRPDTREWVKVESGMFSGVRQTTQFNTILNLTYHRLALRSCYAMGNVVRCPATYVLGDDGWVEFYTEEEAKTYLAAAKLGGMELNALKQLVSQGRGEYLRLIYDKDGKVRGCAVRSLASFVHGNVETNTPSMGAQRISEMYSQACMLVRRGLSRRAWQCIFEDLSVYEIGYAGQVSKRQCLRYLYGTKSAGALGLMPIDKKVYLGTDASKIEEEEEAELSAVDALALSLLQNKAVNKFKASSEFVDRIESEYQVVWKYQGKKQATARIAAQNLADGVQSKETAHTQLLAQVLCARMDKQKWLNALNWDRSIGGPSIGPENIEKQYRKQRIAEDKIIGLVTKISGVAHFMTDESTVKVQKIMSAKLDVPLQAVKAAFKSAGSMKVTAVDYVPKPELVPELEGIYTQWLVINKDENRTTTIPRWVSDFSKKMKY